MSGVDWARPVNLSRGLTAVSYEPRVPWSTFFCLVRRCKKVVDVECDGGMKEFCL